MTAAERQREQRRRETAWWLLLVSLFCCVLEGALRKWVVGDSTVAGRIAYLSKYIPMAVLLCTVARSDNSLAQWAKPFAALGLALLTLGAVVSSISGIEPVGAVLTVLNFVLLPAAAFQAGRQLPPDSLLRLARWTCCIAIVMAPLTVIQFYSPATSRINRYSAGDENVATSHVNDRVRATGTFSYLAGLGEFSNMAVWAGIVTFATARSSRQQWLSYAGLAAGLCCAFTTVSRAVAINSLALVGIWALFGGGMGRKLKSVLLLGLLIAAALVGTGRLDEATELGSTVYKRHRAASSDTISYRLWYQFVVPLDAVVLAPLGNGIGTEQAGRVLNTQGFRAGSTFESPWGRTVMELGVLGLLGMLATWGIPFIPWRATFQACPKGGSKSALLVTGAALVMRAALGYQFNHVAAYLFWATAACILALGNSPAWRTRTSLAAPSSRAVLAGAAT